MQGLLGQTNSPSSTVANFDFKSVPVALTNPKPYNLTLVVPFLLINLGLTSRMNGSKKP